MITPRIIANKTRGARKRSSTDREVIRAVGVSRQDMSMQCHRRDIHLAVPCLLGEGVSGS